MVSVRSRRDFLRALGTGAGSAALAGGVGRMARAADPKPNVVLILVDDLGYGELGAYGQSKILTPNLDRLAEEGMRFTQHYSGSPVCAPSRATLMSGKHTGHTRIRDNYELGGWTDDEERGQMPLLPGSFTIGRMLQETGYRTAAIGKWGLGGPGSTGLPNDQGFDVCAVPAHLRIGMPDTRLVYGDCSLAKVRHATTP